MANTRLAILYLRSRGVLFTVPALLVLIVLTGADVKWLGWVQGMIVVFIALLAAVFLSGGFSTPSPELDAAAPLPWWRWRAGHVLAGLAICTLPLAVAMVHGEDGGVGLAPAMVRNVLGFAGLAFLAAVVVGARLSWTAPLIYALVAWRIPAQASPWAPMWRWPVFPGNTELSWWPALVLWILGTLLLVVRGAASRSG